MPSGPCALTILESHATAPSSLTIESFTGPAVYDSGGFWSSGQPTRATAPTDGWYLMYALVGGDASCGYRAYFKVNGTAVNTLNGQSSGGNVSTETMHMQFLNAGDYVELEWQCDRGSRSGSVNFCVTRLPTPLFLGHCANGDSGFLTWVKDTGCKNDPRLWWDAGNPSRVTVDTTGTYLTMTSCVSSNDMWVVLYKNGATALHEAHNQINSLSGSGYAGGPTMVSLHDLTAGDYLEVNTDALVSPAWFAVALIDPATNMVQATTTGSTIANPQPTLMDFQTETIDTDGFHGGTTSRITVPSGLDGDYWVFGNLGIQSTNIIQFRKNGSSVGNTDRNGTPNIGANNNRWTHGHVSWFETLVAGDYFDITIFGTNGRVSDSIGSFLGMLKLDSASVPWPYENCHGVPQIYRRH